ncbi:MAG TPA: sulfatase [Vicinamibacteria bacterium]|nr:sulfatase [Vicinamibacteria bacterium]
MRRRSLAWVVAGLFAGSACAPASPPAREAARAQVVYDLARGAHAADAEFPQRLLHFGTPATGAVEESGFLSVVRESQGPSVEVERACQVALHWKEAAERVAVLDLEPSTDAARGRLRPSFNGHDLDAVALADGRRRYAIRLPRSLQKARTNRLRLVFEKGPEPAPDGTAASARLFALAYGPAEDPWLRRLADPASGPALQATEDRGVPSLIQAGPSRLTYAIRLPAGARVLLRTRTPGGSEAAFRVTLGAGAEARELWSGAGGAAADVALPVAAGELALLGLEVQGRDGAPTWGVWEAPRVVGFGEQGGSHTEPDAAALARARAALGGVNVVLVIMDAGSAKHFGCYGYPRPTTPEVDRLAADGVVFERAHSPAPNTRVAMASLWTSQYPDENESGFNTRRRLPAERLRLAQVLAARGVHTAGFVANANAEPGLGYDAGFREYHRLYRGSGLVGAESFRPLLERFVAEAKGRGRFFLYVHYKEPHVPYNPPPPFPGMFLPPGAQPVSAGRAMRFVRTTPKKPYPRPEELPGLVALYDGTLAYGDREVGWLRSRLEAAGLLERTVVIVTADHGEALGEHGFIGHNDQVYEESVRIPLVVRFPRELGLAGRRVGALVDHVDMAPTILDLMAVRGDPSAQRAFRGTSLLPVALGAPGRPFTVSRNTGALPVFAIHQGGHKLVLTPRPEGAPKSELFDLGSDPDERRDLAESDPLRAAFHRQELLRFLLALRPDRAAGEAAEPMTPEALENLRALGYVN